MRWHPWVLALVVLLVYLPALGTGFVWDDNQQVVGNLLTPSLANLPQLFTTDVWSSAGVVVENPPYYRPFFLASLAVDRALWGLSPTGHHLQSVLWHISAALTLMGLLRTQVGPLAALAGSAIFALHPLQSESVVWISGRMDPMAATFCFGGIWLLQRATPARLLLGGLALFGAAMSKETGMVAAIVLLPAVDLARHGRLVGRARYAVLAAVVAVWWTLRGAAGVGASGVLEGSRLEGIVRAVPEVLGLYGRLIVWPWPLTHARRLSELSEPLWITATGLVLLAGLLGVTAWRSKTARVGVFFAVATFAPTLLGMASTDFLSERYVYLPLAGVGMALAGVLPERRATWAGLLLLLPAVVLIQLRLPAWLDDVSLSQSAVEVTDSPCAHGQLGEALLLRDGDPEAALPWLITSLERESPCLASCEVALSAAMAVGQSEAMSMLRRLESAGCAATPRLLEGSRRVLEGAR